MESSDRHVFESHEALRAGIDKEKARRDRDAAIHGVAGGVWVILACVVIIGVVVHFNWLNVAIFLGYGLFLYFLERNITVTAPESAWRYSYKAKDGSTVLDEMWFPGERKNHGRILGLTIFQLVVGVGLVFVMSCLHTNFSGNEMAYDKSAKDFVKIGTADWLSPWRYVPVNVQKLTCEDHVGNWPVNGDDDLDNEYSLNGSYTASVEIEAWKRYVKAKIDGGDERDSFEFCGDIKAEMLADFARKAKRSDGEMSDERMDSLAKQFFVEDGLVLDIRFDLTAITRYTKL